MLFEFAVLDRPIVWCDFLWIHWTRKGLFGWRLKRRMDRSIHRYRDLAAHAPSYRDLRRIVDEELARPERFRDARRRAVEALVGPTDGRASERIADWLQNAPAAARRPVPAG